jgi:hypothetical protein
MLFDIPLIAVKQHLHRRIGGKIGLRSRPAWLANAECCHCRNSGPQHTAARQVADAVPWTNETTATCAFGG